MANGQNTHTNWLAKRATALPKSNSLTESPYFLFSDTRQHGTAFENQYPTLSDQLKCCPKTNLNC